MARKKNEEYSDDEQDYADEPNFSDPEGFVDDVDDDGECVKCQHGRRHWLLLLRARDGPILRIT